MGSIGCSWAGIAQAGGVPRSRTCGLRLRRAEWLALVCLHSGVFLRSQYLAFIGRTNPALANRFVRRCRKHAVEQPWNGSRLRLCRVAARRIYRVLGAEHVRHRRPAAPEVVLRRLLSLDYVLEHPHASWLPTEGEKVNALTGPGSPRTCCRADSTRARAARSIGTSPTSCRSRSTASGRRWCLSRRRTRRRGRFAHGARSMPRYGWRSLRPAAPSRWRSFRSPPTVFSQPKTCSTNFRFR